MTAQPKSPRIENPAHLDLVRLLPCCARHLGKCLGIIVAHHRTGAPMGMKVGDDETMPLCWKHHGELHSLAGAFKGWLKKRLRDWQTEMIEQTRAAVVALDLFTPDAIPATGETIGGTF